MPEISESPARRNPWHAPTRIKTCIVCHNDFGLSEFYAYRYTNNQGNRGTRYDSRCKPCARQKRRDDVANDPEKYSAQCKSWRAKNLDRALNYGKEYQEKYRASVHGRAVKARLQRLRKARIRSGSVDDVSIRSLYALAFEIEAIIKDCPVFDLAELGHQIHVDHVVPLSRGGKHVIGNLQLLPAGINMRKGVSCQK